MATKYSIFVYIMGSGIVNLFALFLVKRRLVGFSAFLLDPLIVRMFSFDISVGMVNIQLKVVIRFFFMQKAMWNLRVLTILGC